MCVEFKVWHKVIKKNDINIKLWFKKLINVCVTNLSILCIKNNEVHYYNALSPIF